MIRSKDPARSVNVLASVVARESSGPRRRPSSLFVQGQVEHAVRRPERLVDLHADMPEPAETEDGDAFAGGGLRSSEVKGALSVTTRRLLFPPSTGKPL